MSKSEESFDGTVVVRFDRCASLYTIVNKLENAQLTSYKIKSDASLHDYVTNSLAYDDDSLLHRSHQIAA